MVVEKEIRASTFELVGEDASRKDLAVRRETKYILPNADVGKFMEQPMLGTQIDKMRI